MADRAEERDVWAGVIPRVPVFVLTALALVAALLLAGCSTTAGVVKELAKDPASACISVSTIYGTAIVGRSNNEKVGVSVEGGRCGISPAK